MKIHNQFAIVYIHSNLSLKGERQPVESVVLFFVNMSRRTPSRMDVHLGFRMNIGPRGSSWKLMTNSKIIFADSCHGSWLILHKIEPIAF